MPDDDELKPFEVKVRELFDTSNRVLFADYIREHALQPEIALRPTNHVREVWFTEAEKNWDSFHDECKYHSTAEIDETLAMYKAKEAAQNDPRTLLDHLQLGGLYFDPILDPHEATRGPKTTDSAEVPNLEPGDNQIRPLTQQLIQSAMFDTWPGNAAVQDFGLDTDRHLGALHHAIREELVTPQELDASMGNGPKLTEIAQRGDNPYRNVEFRTAWDGMPIEPEEFLSPEETREV